MYSNDKSAVKINDKLSQSSTYKEKDECCRTTHVTKDMCFPGREKHITMHMCCAGRGRHITRNMCFPGWGTHITDDVFPGKGNT